MIIIDCHEPNQIKNLIEQATETKVCSLAAGDYLIKNIAIERKMLGDFLNSLVQQRLFTQLMRLKAAYPVSFLVVEAFDPSVLQNSRVFYGAILTILLEINVSFNFGVAFIVAKSKLLLLNGAVFV